jgi:hypothetical protein
MEGCPGAAGAISQAVHNPLRRAIAGASPHDVRGTLVSHGGVDLAARWGSQVGVLKHHKVTFARLPRGVY